MVWDSIKSSQKTSKRLRNSTLKMKQNKFTLVELLVVIAVIGILASLLLPVLGKARRTSQVMVSMHNMKQINIAMAMYLDDNYGQYTPGRNPVSYSWDDYLSSYLGTKLTEDEKISDIPDDRSSFKILKCPLDDITRIIHNKTTRSYQLNNYRNGGSKGIFDYNNPLRQSFLPDTSQTIIINEQAKSYNPVGSGSNVILSGDGDLGQVTTGIQLTGNVQYNANHHQNGFKNPLIFADGHDKIMYMPTTTANNKYLWSSKVY